MLQKRLKFITFAYYSFAMEKIYKILFIFLFLFPFQLVSQTPSWVKNLGGTGADVSSGFTTATDSRGNIFISGTFQGTASFGSFSLTASGSDDIFLAKLNCNGTVLWAVKIGSTGTEGTYVSLAINANDKVYITGAHENNCVFTSTDATTINLTSAGSTDIFLAQYDTLGVLQWAKNIGGGSGIEQPFVVAVDKVQDIYVTGYYGGISGASCSFNGTPYSCAGVYDMFLEKLDASGNFIWVRTGGSTGDDIGVSIGIDNANNVYLGIQHWNTLTLSNSTLTVSHHPVTGWDAAVIKYDSSGYAIWAQTISGPQFEGIGGIIFDAFDKVYFTGLVMGTATFSSSGPGLYTATSNGNMDIFLAKYDTTGKAVWLRSDGGTGNDFGRNLVWAGPNNIVIVGTFENSFTNFLGTLTSAGSSDVFFIHFDGTGNRLQQYQFGGIGGDQGWNLVRDNYGNIYASGSFSSTASIGAISTTSNGGSDAFVIKLKSNLPPRNFLPKDTTVCTPNFTINSTLAFDNYLWNNNATTSTITVDTAGLYILKGFNQCDTAWDSIYVDFVKPAPYIIRSTCSTDSIQLQAANGSSPVWTPSTGLSNPNIANPKALPATSTTYYFTRTINNCSVTDTVRVEIFNCAACPTGSGQPGSELVTNGDFESGNTSFLTDYNYQSSSISSPGDYSITNDARNKGSNLARCFDRKTGGGNFLIANGASLPINVWKQTIPVTAGKNYVLSFWAVNVLGGTPAQLDIKINGGVVGSLTVSGTAAFWENVSLVWPSGANISAVIEIVNNNTLGAGNDFGIDDISFRECECSLIPGVTADTTICKGSSLQLLATGGTTYRWLPNLTLSDTSIANPIATPDTTVTYWVYVEDATGCSKLTSVTLQVEFPIAVNIGNDTAICEGTTFNLSSPGGYPHLWSTGDTTQNISFTAIPDTVNFLPKLYWVQTGSVRCPIRDSIMIMTIPKPKIVTSAPANQTICIGESVTLTATRIPGWAPIVWSTGDTDKVITQSPVVPTTYTLQYSNGACLFIDSVHINVISQPSINIGNDTVLCDGSTFILSAPSGMPRVWSTGDTTQTITVTVQTDTVNYIPQLFWVRVGTATCNATDTILIYSIAQPILISSFSHNDTICRGEAITMSVRCYPPYLPVVWSTGDTTKTVNIVPTNTTTFSVEYLGSLCGFFDNIRLVVVNKPTVTLTNDTFICKGNSKTLIASGAGNYLWSTGQTTPTITVSPAVPTTYWVVGRNATCLADTEWVTIDVIDVVAAFTATPTKGKLPLKVDFTNQSTGASAYFWDFGDGSSSIDSTPTYTYQKPGTYTVKLAALTPQGCTDTAYVDIIVENDYYCFIPNAFSPDGNGVNDVFEFKYNGLVKMTGYIFDRWGKLLYEWEIPGGQWWDGNYQGVPCQQDTYMYMVRVKDLENKLHTYKGPLHLIR